MTLARMQINAKLYRKRFVLPIIVATFPISVKKKRYNKNTVNPKTADIVTNFPKDGF